MRRSSPGSFPVFSALPALRAFKVASVVSPSTSHSRPSALFFCPLDRPSKPTTLFYSPSNLLATKNTHGILPEFIQFGCIAACDPRSLLTKHRPHHLKFSLYEQTSKPHKKPGHHPSSRLPTFDRHWCRQSTRNLDTQSSIT